WGEVTIPVADLRGQLVALQSMQYLFAISSDPTALPARTFQYAVDDILWTGGGAVNPTPTPTQTPTPTATPTSTPTPTPTPSDITDLGGSISSQYADWPAGEGNANLTDNNVNAKYLTFTASGLVQYVAPSAYVVTGYTITSANDVPARDPL